MWARALWILAHLLRLIGPKASTALIHAIADIIWLGRNSKVRQLEANLMRVCAPNQFGQVPQLSRRCLRHYARYYFETFGTDLTDPVVVDARVKANFSEEFLCDIAAGPVVIVLPHGGNVDLTAAWALRHLGPVTTVVERIKPAGLFAAFVQIRTQVGMELLAVRAGEKAFSDLLDRVEGRKVIVPLLADRDITGSGVEVTLGRGQALVAAGPAALALKLGCPLYFGSVQHRRLGVDDAVSAGSDYGVTLQVGQPLWQGGDPDQTTVAQLTQAWADQLNDYLSCHSDQWHMLQKVFVADLDQDRLDRARRRQMEQLLDPDQTGTVTPRKNGRGCE